MICHGIRHGVSTGVCLSRQVAGSASELLGALVHYVKEDQLKPLSQHVNNIQQHTMLEPSPSRFANRKVAYCVDSVPPLLSSRLCLCCTVLAQLLTSGGTCSQLWPTWVTCSLSSV